MIDLLFLLVYSAIATYMWFKVYALQYRHFVNNYESLEWDNGERMFAILFGAFMALFWPFFGPVLLIIWGVQKFLKSDVSKKILGPLEKLEK